MDSKRQRGQEGTVTVSGQEAERSLRELGLQRPREGPVGSW